MWRGWWYAAQAGPLASNSKGITMKVAVPSTIKSGPCKAKDCNAPCHYISFPKGGGIPFQFCLIHLKAMERGEDIELETTVSHASRVEGSPNGTPRGGPPQALPSALPACDM